MTAPAASAPAADPQPPPRRVERGKATGAWPWLLGLFAVGLLSRWATRSQLVQAWDAGHFMLALDGLALPSVHFPAYDHDQADFRLDQQGPTIAVRPPLRRLVVLDRGLRMEPPALAGVRDVMVLPGRPAAAGGAHPP